MIAIALDVIVKATAVAALGFLLAGLMRRASAASRHLVWTSVFAALVLLPLARLTLPVVNLAVLAPSPTAPVVVRASIPVAADPSPAPFSAAEPNLPAHPPIERGDDRVTVPAVWTAERIVLTLWIVGAGLVWLRTIIGVVLTRSRGRRARPVVDLDLVGRLDRARHALRVLRPIRLLISAKGWMPVTWGVIHPTILLPSSALAWRRTCPDRIDAVLAHEVAHVGRWDVLSTFVARLGVMMFWFHPLMWIAHRQARLERERACDDAVLALGSRPSDYAGHLIAVVRSLATPAAMTDTLAMAQSSQIERRVRAILDARVNRRRASRTSVAMAAMSVAAVLSVASARLTARALPPDVLVPVSLDVPAATALPVLPPAAGPATYVHAAAPTSLRPLPSPPRIALSAGTAVPQAIQAQQTAPPAQVTSSTAAAWRAEREALLRQLLDRAMRHWQDALKKVEIGTLAPIDTVSAETTVAQLEQALLAEQKRPLSNVAPSEAELADVRRRVAAALRNLDAAEVRWNNRLITDRELSAAVHAVADAMSVPATATAGGQDAMFNTTNFPGSTSADRNNARALYELLTGRVSSVSGTQAQSALQNIQDAQRLLQNQQTPQAGQSVKSLLQQAEELAKLQRDVAVQVADLVNAGAQRNQRMQQLSQTKDEMRGKVAAIEQQLDRLGRAAQDLKDEDAARRLQGAAGLVRDKMIKEKIEYSKQSMAAGSEYSKPIENEITFNLDALRQSISEASQAADRARQPPLSDAALITALKDAAKIASGYDRANTLIALAQRHVFTPEMVSLYVAAASGIPTEADRTRAFAQAIRVKPNGK